MKTLKILVVLSICLLTSGEVFARCRDGNCSKRGLFGRRANNRMENQREQGDLSNIGPSPRSSETIDQEAERENEVEMARERLRARLIGEQYESREREASLQAEIDKLKATAAKQLKKKRTRLDKRSSRKLKKQIKRLKKSRRGRRG